MENNPTQEGFYKVRNDDGWTVMYFDGAEWYDHVSGQYAECENSKFILETGERVDPTPNKTYKNEAGDNCSLFIPDFGGQERTLYRFGDTTVEAYPEGAFERPSIDDLRKLEDSK